MPATCCSRWARPSSASRPSPPTNRTKSTHLPPAVPRLSRHTAAWPSRPGYNGTPPSSHHSEYFKDMPYLPDKCTDTDIIIYDLQCCSTKILRKAASM
mmetsp:Transcript_20218/g.27776  ORF Transcript_20218/g.27776 Transcript_20218/m.27776 type:complete len:98 (+) Transcript_20218:361-654(+)